MVRATPSTPALLPDFEWTVSLQAFDHLWHSNEQIGLQAVVGHREDRGLGILVDRHDHLAVLHTGQMLDRTRDTGGDVAVRGCCQAYAR